ncbi:MAG TPA: stage V sporulation protein AE [Ruminiclostridium sp.]|jgi:stage V sporulation protein AE|nr:stage V sporulation protein AE [Ruminiclostridium sp.]
MDYVRAFIVGGLFCVVGQILIDKTKMTPARILVIFVTAGVLLTALGIYDPIVNFGGAGATVPLTGFGYALAKGVEKSVHEQGLLGAFTGGVIGTAGGIAAAIFFGYVIALIFKPGDKS